MNELDDLPLNKRGFAFRDLLGQSRWESFVPIFGSLTVVGTPTYTGRLMVVGRLCFFQVSLVSSTSIASVAGTDYLTLPKTALGLGGVATLANDTSNIAVGLCHIDTATSRCFLPSQTASGNTFTLSGWFEA